MPIDDLASSAAAGSKESVYTISSYGDTRSNVINKGASHDPADYIQKARVTRAVPPRPAYDPLQFVQLKPCSLVKTAQEQVKIAENVKKANEEKKEEPEEWQCNLDNWKSSRRKRVEHIIDRVVEVKKFELEEHDRNRRKSKTFNEMMEERGSRRRKHLPIYMDDDNNELSELGLSVSNPSAESPKNDRENEESLNNNEPPTESDSNEYTYEGAIENYKSRVSRTAGYIHQNSIISDQSDNNNSEQSEKPNTTWKLNQLNDIAPLSPDNNGKASKIDFMKRKELFEKEHITNSNESGVERASSDCINTISVKERLSILELNQESSNKANRNLNTSANVSFTDLKNRLEVFEREIRNVADNNQNATKICSSLYPGSSSHDQTLVAEQKNDGSRTDVRPKDVLNSAEKQSLDHNVYVIFTQKQASEIDENENIDTDREDSGIHTTDVSCSVSQADEQNEEPEQQVENTLSKDSGNKENRIQSEADYSNDVSILDDALEMAFQEIDNMEGSALHKILLRDTEPIYQNLNEIDEISPQNVPENPTDGIPEPYYQVPQSQEPYYEVPKTKRIPLYENVTLSSAPDNCENVAPFVIDFGNKLQPPKEKPPPPPVNPALDDERAKEAGDSMNYMQRINSMARAREEIHCKRSNFLGIDVMPSNNQMESRTFSHKEGYMKERSVIEETQLRSNYNTASNCDSSLLQNYAHHDGELTRKSCDNLSKDVSESKELQINGYKEFDNHYQHADGSVMHDTSDTHNVQGWLCNDNLQEQEEFRNPIQPHSPPAKPLRSSHLLHQQYSPHCEHRSSLSNIMYLEQNQQLCLNASTLSDNTQTSNINSSAEDIAHSSDKLRHHKHTPCQQWLSKYNGPTTYEHDSADPSYHNYMLRKRSYTECSPQRNVRSMDNTANHNSSTDLYNRHWFIQEAEQRRIEQQQKQMSSQNSGNPNKSSNRKSLPESVIQTITQRVQNLGIGTDRRWPIDAPTSISRLPAADTRTSSPNLSSLPVSQNNNENDDKVLSVSGKKKCSHCNLELGRGAAMVIESLGLLYHIDCFKCCVCHARLGDGFKGTDVRVRKFKLHCQNCFSSEDGVKFSCV